MVQTDNEILLHVQTKAGSNPHNTLLTSDNSMCIRTHEGYRNVYFVKRRFLIFLRFPSRLRQLCHPEAVRSLSRTVGQCKDEP